MSRYRWLSIALFGALTFIAAGQHSTPGATNIKAPSQLTDRVVISAPMQILMYGGDRFLAADLEMMRLATTASVSNNKGATSYLTRAHRLIAQLNPCHEDNYYLGNALLSFGGVESEGSELLRRATECRHWDWVPPFFYGFNQYYFHRNAAEAQRSFEVAAQRSPENSASLRKNAIMIASGQFDDDRMALNYLKLQRDQATDQKLRQMLEKRVLRLDGLIALRDAQKRFEEQSGRSLKTPQELLSSGHLEQFPVDPLGLGYEFREKIFQLRQLNIPGMEDQQ